MRRVLVVQTAFLGDLVLTQPLIAELARAFHPVKVDVLVRAPFADLTRGFPDVGEVIPFDKRGADRGLGGFFRQRKRLATARYELAVSPHGSFRTGMLLAAARIPRRIGFANAKAATFMTVRVPRPKGPYPEILRTLLIAAGAGPGADDPVLVVKDAARASADAKLAERGIAAGAAIVGLNPGSVWGTKRWMPEGWGALCVEIAARGLRPVIVGGKDDVTIAEAVLASAKGTAVDLSGKTSLPELAAVAARAAVFVSGDSGPMHIAAAVGTPVVAIFGPTTPELGFAPRTKAAEIVQRSLECRPCHRHGPQVCPLGHFKCMRDIPASDVMSAVGRLLP